VKRNIDALAAYGIAGICFLLSFGKLVDLAERAGYGEHMAKVWPIAVDGLAVMAARAVLRLGSGRLYAWSLLVGGTLVSILAAVLNSMVPPGPLPPLATAAVAIVPPLCLPLAAHLARMMRDAAPAEAEPDAAPAEAPAEAPNTAVLPQEPSAASADSSSVVAAPAEPQATKPRLVEVVRPAAVRKPQVRTVAAVEDAAPEAAEKAAPAASAAKPRRRSAKRIEDDPELVARAARLHAEGETLRGIGRELGIDDRSVRRMRDKGLLAA
jgi:hypothetical protein